MFLHKERCDPTHGPNLIRWEGKPKPHQPFCLLKPAARSLPEQQRAMMLYTPYDLPTSHQRCATTPPKRHRLRGATLVFSGTSAIQHKKKNARDKTKVVVAFPIQLILSKSCQKKEQWRGLICHRSSVKHRFLVGPSDSSWARI